MRRREFITVLGGTAIWPLVAGAQQSRLIGILMQVGDTDVEAQTRIKVFKEKLQQLGWSEGRNIEFVYRWTDGKDELARTFAKELVDLRPDVIVGQGTISTRALQQATHTVPVVFVQVTNPVGAGFVPSLPRPGGNITGFAMYEPDMGTKWLELQQRT